MARERSPNRDKAFEIWQQSGGKISNREIATKLNEDEKKIAVWKQRDKWNVVQQSNSNVVQQKKERCTTKPKKHGGQPGNKNAVGHGAPKGNQNSVGHKSSVPMGNQNAIKHGFYSQFIPLDELDMLMDAPGAGQLEKDLKLARYKLARLLKYQQELRMRGVVVGPDGVEKITLLDDFYEPLIQKQIKLISELELKIHKMQDDSNGDNDNVEIVDDLGGNNDAGKIE